MRLSGLYIPVSILGHNKVPFALTSFRLQPPGLISGVARVNLEEGPRMGFRGFAGNAEYELFY